MHPHKNDADGSPGPVAPSKGFREASILSIDAFHILPHSFLPRWLPTQVERASKLILNDGIHPHMCFEGNALGHVVALDTYNIVTIKQVNGC